MWFKQMTCDNCFTTLENVGRHNCYIMVRFTDFRIIPFNLNSPQTYTPYQRQFPIAFVSCTSMKPAGNMFMYSIIQEDSNLQNRSYFCSNKCACEYAKQNNCIMLYFDEPLQAVKSIVPHIEQINRELGINDYKGLPFNWQQEWIIPRSSFVDLSMYNCNIAFPELNYPYKLTFLKSQDESDYLNLLLDKSFQYSFYGSNNFPEERVKDIKGHIKSYELNFGRRLGIEWIIRENDKFIGFIRMNCINPNDPYNWYIEFGLTQNMRGKGIMKNGLNCVLKWCKENGLNNIFATCEVYNEACNRLMLSMPYSVQSTKIPANDDFAGYRMLNRFSVSF